MLTQIGTKFLFCELVQSFKRRSKKTTVGMDINKDMNMDITMYIKCKCKYINIEYICKILLSGCCVFYFELSSVLSEV